jgi:DnaJ-class molecular chaperone
MKIKCKECNGEGAYEYANWETSNMENIECSYCDGQGYNEEDIEEFTGKKSVTHIDKICDRVKAKLEAEEEWTDITISFTGDPSRNYHVTYFISRGEVTAEETPLLGGLTLSADSITHAIIQFMTTTGVDEKEIKYIVEL